MHGRKKRITCFKWWSQTPEWLVRIGYPDPRTTPLLPPWTITWNVLWSPLWLAGACTLATYGFIIGGPRLAKRFWRESR